MLDPFLRRHNLSRYHCNTLSDFCCDLRGYELNLVEQEKRSIKKKNARLKELVKENKHLQAQIDEIRGQLMTMNEIKMQLAALTEARVASN